MKSMRSIRGVFVVISAVLLIALLLLIRKAYRSAASERSAEHRAVAERILDEMERELTDLLRREENRPFEHYRASFLPENFQPGETVAPVRSPLAGVPEESFLLGYFQIDPDGTISTPHHARTSAAGGPSADVVEWIEDLEEVIRLVWQIEAPPPAPVVTQKAGSTVEIAPKAAAKDLRKRGYLESLNKGARSRSRRLSKLEQTQAWNVAWRLESEAVETADAAAGRDISQLRKGVAPGFLDVRLEPMVGRSASEGLMVLYRTVSIDERAFRQGLLIAEEALVDWLTGRVVTDDAVASRASFIAESAAGGAPAPPGFAGYSYRHRFAEPFGSVRGVLHLEELPELTGTTFLSALSLLLLLTASLGLFGLYRMVAVVVEFAERRHNFVSAVTHELKTPLTAIRMYGEMLRDGVIPEEGKRQQYYETITAETERLTRLLQNVLELARLEKDTRTMNVTVGDVGQVIAEVTTLLEPHADRKGFVLRVEVEDGLPQVRYDRDALVQVLFNLVDNALKYAGHCETKEIVLRARRAGAGVSLSVIDHGPGVARQHLRKIFEPFYRGENELTRTTQGTGIGLALVRGLVERMGGRVLGRNAGDGGFEVLVSLNPA